MNPLSSIGGNTPICDRVVNMNQALSVLVTQLHPKGWTSIFSAMLQSSVELHDEQATQKWLFSTGVALGESLALSGDLSLEELQVEINAVLDRMQWGYAELVQKGNEVYVRHMGCPFLIASPPNQIELAGLLLGGLYYQWFTTLGMDPSTEVSVVAEDDSGLLAEISFI